MPTQWHTLYVPEGLFGLLDGGDVPDYSADWSNGLLAPLLQGGAFIKVGIHSGNVRVRSETLITRPPSIDDSLDWEEIVEASVNAPNDQLQVESLLNGPIDDGRPLAQNGSTSYRVHLHALGRSIAWDKTSTDPTETYLLQVWPAPPEPTQTLRSSDRLRASQATHAQRPLPPLEEPPATPPDEPRPAPHH